MKLKFFTILCFVLLFSFYSKAADALVLQNDSTGKIVEVQKGKKVYFQLLSDTVLNLEMQDEYGIVTFITDTSFFLEDDQQIPFSDLRYLKVESKRVILMRKIATPFLGIGFGFLGRGIYQASFEGFEKDNKTLVPLQLGGGLAVSALSVWPFLVKPKAYQLHNGPWSLTSR